MSRHEHYIKQHISHADIHTHYPLAVTKLYDALKKLQEPKGYYFNPDKKYVLSILEQLLTTKGRYGYMSCPCRLANGLKEYDKDIICPCNYRENDVRDYGSCYCKLYGTKAWNDGNATPAEYIPDRRPVDNILCCIECAEPVACNTTIDE